MIADNQSDEMNTPTTTPAPFSPALAMATALYLVYTLGMLFFNRANITLPSIGWAVVAITSTFAYLLMIGVVIRLLARPLLSTRQEVSFMLLSLLLFLALNPIVWQLVRQLINGAPLASLWNMLESPPAESLPLIILAAITPLFLILTGLFSGRLLARMIKEISILVPVAIIAAMVDFWGVYWGVVATIERKSSGGSKQHWVGSDSSRQCPRANHDPCNRNLALFSTVGPPRFNRYRRFPLFRLFPRLRFPPRFLRRSHHVGGWWLAY